jgi:carbon dioxide concentrating mechanism protein CcmN
MYLPPLQAMQDSQVRVSGDVTIHPSAVIAPGVLLQASPDSAIVIGAGVCIGMGSVLHACEGKLEIQDGVSLGAGVLIVGCGTIGARACIGSLSTLLNASVDGQMLVPSGSILGDRSRQTQLEPVVEPVPHPQVAPSPPDPSPSPAAKDESEPISTFRYPEPVRFDLNSPAQTAPVPTPPEPEKKPATAVHGQAYVNSLLSTLLPHRNGQMSSPPDA